ncbi:MAG: NFACT RNA binding domain-containing protein [Lachnospiraceae bacterium]|nr:NFACT RNA binding domain-containing protein [Lachnospiraceae bacterium]
MALDGLTIHALAYELKNTLNNGRLLKIAQPENDELQLTIRVEKNQYKLLISAGASLPLMYITEGSKTSPLTAPNFCMLLRKHLNNAKIIDIYQPGLERIINIKVEHYNDMGDLCYKLIIVELMGKYSNIIVTDLDGKIVDSIKHISANISSVREVLPGRAYFIPDTTNKKNPLDISKEDFLSIISDCALPISKAIYTSFTGISPVIGEEICYRSNIDSEKPANVLDNIELEALYNTFDDIMECVKLNKFQPNIIYTLDGQDLIPKEFAPFTLSLYSDEKSKVTYIDSISQVLEQFYSKKSAVTRIRQKSYDLRRIVQTTLEKDYKKYEIQSKQLKDTEKKDKYKIYGELITAFGYGLEPNATSLTAQNYYDNNNEIVIPLDKDLTPMENAKKYYDKYSKLKRTAEALENIIIETEEEISHLESIMNALDIAVTEDDLKEIKEELIQSGYIRRKSSDKKAKYTSKPFHYVSSDGYDIYVGKNNIQNEELTFKVANGGDWWFHSKNFPGSHVIVKTNGDELPDRTFEEAARLAAYYSKGREQDKVEIDYIQRKHIKKVAGSKPGFVIYHTNYSMAISPNINNLKEI